MLIVPAVTSIPESLLVEPIFPINVAVPDDPDTVNPFAVLVLLSSVLFKVKSPP